MNRTLLLLFLVATLRSESQRGGVVGSNIRFKEKFDAYKTNPSSPEAAAALLDAFEVTKIEPVSRQWATKQLELAQTTVNQLQQQIVKQAATPEEAAFIQETAPLISAVTEPLVDSSDVTAAHKEADRLEQAARAIQQKYRQKQDIKAAKLELEQLRQEAELAKLIIVENERIQREALAQAEKEKQLNAVRIIENKYRQKQDIKAAKLELERLRQEAELAKLITTENDRIQREALAQAEKEKQLNAVRIIENKYRQKLDTKAAQAELELLRQQATQAPQLPNTDRIKELVDVLTHVSKEMDEWEVNFAKVPAQSAAIRRQQEIWNGYTKELERDLQAHADTMLLLADPHIATTLDAKVATSFLKALTAKAERIEAKLDAARALQERDIPSEVLQYVSQYNKLASMKLETTEDIQAAAELLSALRTAAKNLEPLNQSINAGKVKPSTSATIQAAYSSSLYTYKKIVRDARHLEKLETKIEQARATRP